MKKYNIRFTLGTSSNAKASKNFVGQNGLKSIEAENRVDAYKKFCHFFKAEEITVLENNPQYETPLGFSDEEINKLKGKNIPFNIGLPKSGIQIQEIEREYC